jgi:hypothetical protein
MASVITVYAAGEVLIGRVHDFGPEKDVLADAVNDSGRFVSIGFYRNRRAAQEAVEEMHRSRTGSRPGGTVI